MSNLVLYRKYRPKNFSEIVGQGHIVKTLTNAISAGSVSHAYLFSGARGTGKTTIARLLAKAVNCKSRKEFTLSNKPVFEKLNPQFYEPCNRCFSCEEINRGRALDIVEIDAASNRGIDEIRELKKAVKVSSTSLDYKVYIIDEVHMLTREAFNALLKTLEEPPSNTIFILATTEIHKVPATILSRCQRFDFKKLTVLEIVFRLKQIVEKEKFNIEDGALELIAINSRGSIRDGESFLEQMVSYQDKSIGKKDVQDILGIVDLNASVELVGFLAAKDVRGAIVHINKINESGYDLSKFSQALIDYLRTLMLIKVDSNLIKAKVSGLSEEEIEKAKVQVVNFAENDLQKMVKLFIDAQNEIKRSPIPQLPLELAVVELLQQN